MDTVFGAMIDAMFWHHVNISYPPNVICINCSSFQQLLINYSLSCLPIKYLLYVNRSCFNWGFSACLHVQKFCLTICVLLPVSFGMCIVAAMYRWLSLQNTWWSGALLRERRREREGRGWGDI